MNNTGIVTKWDKLVNTIDKNSPTILIATGIAGMFGSMILMSRAVIKSTRKIDAIKEAKKDSTITKKEAAAACWKYYIPPILTFATSTACLISSHSVNCKRNAALATAYKISETALMEYKNKVVEVLGEKKEATIARKVDKSKIEANPVSENTIIMTGEGDTLCYESFSGRYFQTSMEKLHKVEYVLNDRLVREGYVPLNDFYDEMGLSFTDIGSQLGWSQDKGFIEFNFSSQLADNNKPCLVLNFKVGPKYGYDSLY